MSHRKVMHIKKRTEGTSNELSFSVLDAKSSVSDAPSASPRTLSALGKVSVFTVPDRQSGEPSAAISSFGMSQRRKNQAAAAVGGSVIYSLPMQEVKSRKRHRRFVRLLQAVGALALVAIIVLAGVQLTGNVVQRQKTSHASIDTAIELLAQTDEAMFALDDAVTAPAQSSNQVLKQRISDLAAAASLLDRAANAAEEAATLTADSVNAETAAEAKASAAARKDLVEAGRIVLIQGAAAKRAADLAVRTWDAAAAADALARQAVEALEANPKAIEESMGLSEQAIAGFQDALVLLRQAKEVYPQADFSLLEEYLELRGAAQQNALAADEAAQAGDESLENANTIAYNSVEGQAARIAAQMPEDPAQPVVDVYAVVGAEADAAYQEARERASSADAALRTYLEEAR